MTYSRVHPKVKPNQDRVWTNKQNPWEGLKVQPKDKGNIGNKVVINGKVYI